MVLVRQSRDDGFLKRPDSEVFQRLFQRAVRLRSRTLRTRRLRIESERLESQTPNMATISRGATMTLPSLDGHGVSRHQNWRRVDRDNVAT